MKVSLVYSFPFVFILLPHAFAREAFRISVAKIGIIIRTAKKKRIKMFVLRNIL